jgi:RNA polymerase sigma-70 factor, ECF subfamily
MSVPRPPAPNEAYLVARAVAGDRQAFGDLYECHLDAIYRYIYYRVGDTHEAEDLTETVFVKAWEALDRYRAGEVPFAAWLYRIAHNQVVDRHRTARPTAELPDQHPDPGLGANPEAQAAQNEMSRVLAAALAQLDPLGQQVLTLRFINGLSHAETAQIVERPEGTVRVLQHRALAQLRGLLLGQMDAHG